MPSQLDLDQGGTARTWQKIYLGPSGGWILIPDVSVLPIVASGTYTLDPSTNYVTVNVASPVTIFLPTMKIPTGGLQGQTMLFAQSPITIADVGGFAGANPVTIKPATGSETIVSLAQIQITTAFGAYTLAPNSQALTWNIISP